jgi:hypothetical protein
VHLVNHGFQLSAAVTLRFVVVGNHVQPVVNAGQFDVSVTYCVCPLLVFAIAARL